MYVQYIQYISYDASLDVSVVIMYKYESLYS